jgi:hypothetical protein
MSRDNDFSKRMDKLLKEAGGKPARLDDLLKEAPKDKVVMPAGGMPPLPTRDQLRGAGAIPVEDNAPQLEVPFMPKAVMGSKVADDSVPPPPLVPEGSPLPANAPVKPMLKAPGKGLPR